MNEGFISLNRKILDWEWYTDTNTKVVFIHCLLKANFVEKKWRGITIERGSFVSSYEKIAKETGLSVMQVRTSIKHLILTREITKCSTSKYTLFKVLKYDEYQDNNKQSNKQLTNKQQTSNKQVTTTNKENNENKENKYIYKRKHQKIIQTWDYPEEEMSEEERCQLIKEIEEFKE